VAVVNPQRYLPTLYTFQPSSSSFPESSKFSPSHVGKQSIEEEKILAVIKQVFDFSPKHMITELKLDTPIYQETTCYGHFGKNLPWEKLDKIATIKEVLKNLK